MHTCEHNAWIIFFLSTIGAQEKRQNTSKVQYVDFPNKTQSHQDLTDMKQTSKKQFFQHPYLEIHSEYKHKHSQNLKTLTKFPAIVKLSNGYLSQTITHHGLKKLMRSASG